MGSDIMSGDAMTDLHMKDEQIKTLDEENDILREIIEDSGIDADELIKLKLESK